MQKTVRNTHDLNEVFDDTDGRYTLTDLTVAGWV